jgi:hypothetical protein
VKFPLFMGCKRTLDSALNKVLRLVASGDEGWSCSWDHCHQITSATAKGDWSAGSRVALVIGETVCRAAPSRTAWEEVI